MQTVILFTVRLSKDIRLFFTLWKYRTQKKSTKKSTSIWGFYTLFHFILKQTTLKFSQSLVLLRI